MRNSQLTDIFALTSESVSLKISINFVMHYSGIQIKKIPYKFIQNNILSVWHTLYKDWTLENTSWAAACSIKLYGIFLNCTPE